MLRKPLEMILDFRGLITPFSTESFGYWKLSANEKASRIMGRLTNTTVAKLRMLLFHGAVIVLAVKNEGVGWARNLFILHIHCLLLTFGGSRLSDLGWSHDDVTIFLADFDASMKGVTGHRCEQAIFNIAIRKLTRS